MLEAERPKNPVLKRLGKIVRRKTISGSSGPVAPTGKQTVLVRYHIAQPLSTQGSGQRAELKGSLYLTIGGRRSNTHLPLNEISNPKTKETHAPETSALQSAMTAFGITLPSPATQPPTPSTPSSLLAQHRANLLRTLQRSRRSPSEPDVRLRLHAMSIAERNHQAWEQKKLRVGPDVAEREMRKLPDERGEGSGKVGKSAARRRSTLPSPLRNQC